MKAYHSPLFVLRIGTISEERESESMEHVSKLADQFKEARYTDIVIEVDLTRHR